MVPCGKSYRFDTAEHLAEDSLVRETIANGRMALMIKQLRDIKFDRIGGLYLESALTEGLGSQM